MISQAGRADLVRRVLRCADSERGAHMIIQSTGLASLYVSEIRSVVEDTPWNMGPSYMAGPPVVDKGMTGP